MDTLPAITPDMTVLDIVAVHKGTEAVFRVRDQAAGECILCNALFDTVRQVAQRYSLDLDALMADLRAAAGQSRGNEPES